MRKPKLFSAGCSIADRTQTTHCYGDYLAEMLDRRYVHFCGGAGSNERSIRLITHAVLNKQMTPDDLLLIQFTDVSRRELPSAWLTHTKSGKKIAQHHLAKIDIAREKFTALHGETYHDMLDTPYCDASPAGIYTRYKMDSHMWQENEQDRKLHETVQFTCSDEAMDHERFMSQFVMLDAFLKQREIPHIYVWESCGGTQLGWWEQNHWSKMPVQCGDSSSKNHFMIHEYWPEHRSREYEKEMPEYHLVPFEDYIHYSLLGHKTIANHLYSHIQRFFDK